MLSLFFFLLRVHARFLISCKKWNVFQHVSWLSFACWQLWNGVPVIEPVQCYRFNDWDTVIPLEVQPTPIYITGISPWRERQMAALDMSP
jgi:hypothetical protein